MRHDDEPAPHPAPHPEPTLPDPDEEVRRRAARSLAADDATGWFEELYQAARRGEAVVPWDRGGPHPLLVQWLALQPLAEGRAVVVGAGLGGDAEYLASLGWDTVAFDVSPTGIASARARFPGSRVDYVVADLLDLPPAWLGAFDLVVEIFTVQALPRSLRREAIRRVAGLVGAAGTLVVVAFAGEAAETPEGPPWPLSRGDMASFAAEGLVAESLELAPHPDDQTTLRWQGTFRRRPPS